MDIDSVIKDFEGHGSPQKALMEATTAFSSAGGELIIDGASPDERPSIGANFVEEKLNKNIYICINNNPATNGRKNWRMVEGDALQPSLINNLIEKNQTTKNMYIVNSLSFILKYFTDRHIDLSKYNSEDEEDKASAKFFADALTEMNIQMIAFTASASKQDQLSLGPLEVLYKELSNNGWNVNFKFNKKTEIGGEPAGHALILGKR